MPFSGLTWPLTAGVRSRFGLSAAISAPSEAYLMDLALIGFGGCHQHTGDCSASFSSVAQCVLCSNDILNSMNRIFGIVYKV